MKARRVRVARIRDGKPCKPLGKARKSTANPRKPIRESREPAENLRESTKTHPRISEIRRESSRIFENLPESACRRARTTLKEPRQTSRAKMCVDTAFSHNLSEHRSTSRARTRPGHYNVQIVQSLSQWRNRLSGFAHTCSAVSGSGAGSTVTSTGGASD